MTKTKGLFHLNIARPKFTGKRLIKINPDATHKTITSKAKNVSINLASSSDFTNDYDNYTQAFEEADGIVFEGFRVAIVNEDKEEQVSRLTDSSQSKNTFIYSEPERYIYAVDNNPEISRQQIRTSGRRPLKARSSQSKTAYFRDDAVASWGIHAVNILNSKFTGKGVNIAILDTGFNLGHPDFAGRIINTRSFISEEEVNDQNGHGTHCTGISTGGNNKVTNRRYGVAREANIFIGKVLSNAGSGSDSGILAGMEWAINNNCRVISMSLGAPVDQGEAYSNIYNDIAKKAMSKGTLIIAAAGNESRRDQGMINPVGHPANCPAIMAVAALDRTLNVAYFSCGGINPDGGQVDIAAPGVEVYSSWKSPGNYNIISGTSMATPCVAGIAALFNEAFPEATASDIWMYITQNAFRLDLNSSDVGAGLVQPPK